MTDLVEQFKAAFRRHPAGVTLIVGTNGNGPLGLTATSVTSVSATPPMVSLSFTQSSTTAAALTQSRELAVILLAEHQASMAADLATRGAPRFTTDQGWIREDNGLPILKEAPATLRGTPKRVLPAGDSWLVVLEVTDVQLGPPAAPLVYYNRTYWSLAALPTSS